VQCLYVDRRRLLLPAALEHNACSLQQLVLPLRDLLRLNIELLRQLGDRIVALDRR